MFNYNNRTLKYFQSVTTFEDLKRQYRQLCKQYHPDVNHNTDTTSIMQEINAEYEYITEHGIPKSSTDSRKTDINDINDGFREIIEKIIHLDDVITVEICGCWIWVGGNTFKSKDILKSNGFKWASAKKLWYWKPEEWSRKVFKPLSMDKIRSRYGSEMVKEQKKVSVAM